MARKCLFSILLLICAFFATIVPLSAQEEEGEIIVISERVGKEIDPEERDKFKLFQEIKGFQSAVYIKLPDGRYFLKITYLDEKTGEIKISRTQQSEASIKNRRDYIDSFEEIQAEEHQYQNLFQPQTVNSDSGEIQARKVDADSSQKKTFCLSIGFGLPIFERWTRTIRSFKSYAYSL